MSEPRHLKDASLVPRAPVAPVSVTRADTVGQAVRDALSDYRSVLNTNVDIRSVHIDIKFNKRASTVRTVLISTQGETSKR